MERRQASMRVQLIQSEDEEPRVTLAQGRTYKVVSATVVDSDLEAVAAEAQTPQARPARLCGSGSTCIAVVQLETEELA